MKTGRITRRTPKEELPDYLRVEEAAAFLGIGRSLAYELARTGAWPVVRFGRVLRVRRDALLATQEAKAS